MCSRAPWMKSEKTRMKLNKNGHERNKNIVMVDLTSHLIYIYMEFVRTHLLEKGIC